MIKQFEINIIIEKIKMLIWWLVLVYFFILRIECQINKQSYIDVYVHQWCKKSKIAFDIVKKIEQKYREQINFNYHIEKGENHQAQTVYPTIKINCQGLVRDYENQMSYLELQYWIKVFCLNAIPECSKWMADDHTYQVNPRQLSQTLLNWTQQNPSIKICSNSSVRAESDSNIMMLLDKAEQFQYFQSFSHNLRNQIIKNEKTVIGYLYGKKSKKLREFEEYVERLREKDKRLGYHLSERGRGRIIFLSDNMNKKIIKKLLGFLRIEKSNEEVIVYLRFVGDKFIGGNYGNMEFDNVLTYWMQQVIDYEQKNQNSFCLDNSLIHYYKSNSISSISQNIQLASEINELIQIENRQVLWVNPQQQYQLCLKDQKKKFLGTLAQIMKFLTTTNEQL